MCLKTIKGNKHILSRNTLPHLTVISILPTNCSDDVQQDLAKELLPSCVQLVIIMKRRLTHSFMHIFVPSTLVVLLSWMMFWIDIEAAPARAGLGVTCFLTLATQLTKNEKMLPPVSYLKAVDVWTLFCVFMVFGSILEFTIASYINRRNKHQKEVKKSKLPILANLRKKSSDETVLVNTKRKTSRVCLHDNYVDRQASILFPSLYLLFNIIFWSVYLPPYYTVSFPEY